MKLISCESCGLVYDQDNIDWPEAYDENLVPILDNAVWDGLNGFSPTFRCVCGERVMKEG